MYRVIYEAQEAGFDIKSFVIIAILVILDIALWLWVLYDLKKGNTGDKLFIIIPFILTVAVISLIYSDLTVPDFYDEYQNGNYSVCEGKIYEYESLKDNNYDSFYVNNELFFVSDNLAYGYGYTKRIREGGELNTGINVRICYIPYKSSNVIMKLELSE